MIHAERKQRARKFNVCKKICQLTKIISVFSMQFQDQLYQRNYLHNLYSSLISEQLNQAWRSVENIYKSNDNFLKISIDKYNKIYLPKVNNLRINLNVIFQSTKEMHERKERQIMKQVEYRNNEALNYMQKVELCSSEFDDKRIDEFKKDLDMVVKQLRIKLMNDQGLIFNEFSEKVGVLKTEHEKKVNKMKQDFELEKKLLLIKNRDSNKSITENKLLYLPSTIESLKKECKKQQNNFITIKEPFEKKMFQIKQKIFEEIKSFKVLSQKHKKKREKLICEIKKYNELQNERDDLIQQFQRNKQKNKEKHINSQKLLDENKERFDNNRKFYESNQLGRQANLNSILNNIKSQYMSEIQNIEREYYLIQQNAKEKILNLEDKINRGKTKNENIKKKYQNKLNDIQQKNSEEIKAFRDIFSNDIIQLNNNHSVKKNEIKQQFTSLKETLSKLTQEKELILNAFSSFLENFEKRENSRIADLKSTYNLTISNLKNSLESELNKYKNKIEETKAQVKENLQKKKIDFVQQNDFIYSQKIVKIQFNLNSDSSKIEDNFNKEKENIINQYTLKYKDLQEQLMNIEPPKMEQSIVKHNSELEIELNSTIEKNNKEKIALIEYYNQKIEEENQRHQNYLIAQKEIENLIQQIKNIRKTKDEDIKKLQQIINKIMEILDLKVKIQQDFKKKIEEIDKKYKKQKKSKIQELEKVKNDIDQEKGKWQNMITEIKKIHQLERNHLNLKNNNIKLLVVNRNSNLNISIDYDEEEYIRKSRNHKAEVKKLKEKIHDTKTALQLTKNEQLHSLNLNQNKRVKQINSLQEKYMKEMDELKKIYEEEKKSLSHIFSLQKSKSTTRSISNHKSSGSIRAGSSRVNRTSSISLPAINGRVEKTAKPSTAISSEDRIALLTQQLQDVNQTLTDSLNEFQQCKYLLIAQENRFNAQFGQNHRVGLLQVSPR